MLRGGPVFFIFFLLFTIASLAVPVPLFPGNMIILWVNLPSPEYAPLFSALANGFLWGMVVWIVFVIATRKLDESGVSDYKSTKGRRAGNSRKRATKH